MDKKIIIQPQSNRDLDFMIALLEKLGFSHKVVSDSELEDRLLLRSMIEEKKGDYVSEDEIKKELNKK